jgi:hypothetical protein
MISPNSAAQLNRSYGRVVAETRTAGLEKRHAEAAICVLMA